MAPSQNSTIECTTDCGCTSTSMRSGGRPKSQCASMEELSELDSRHEEIWETLMRLNEADNTRDRLVEKVISTYLTEAAKLFDKVENEKNEQRQTENDAEADGNGEYE